MELLTLNEISKNIKSKKILKDVSFTLNSSDIIGLVGGNGAGKTTLMKVILGLSSYQSGNLKSHTLNK
ncbi:ATP-binding cassette domain-containing protein, partial [Staphylococcus epidermidis]